MKIVFVSNYFNHHQHKLSDALYKQTGGEYAFIATSQMREDRRQLGYGEDEIPEYVVNSYVNETEKTKSSELIAAADAVIVGSAPEEMIKAKIAEGAPIFRYSERPLKIKKSLPELVKLSALMRLRNPAKKPIYLLCAGAYTAADYAKLGVFKGRAYKWGYFPETKQYNDINELISKKKKNSILWAGRFIDWKHADDALTVAARLKENGYEFEMNFIGAGEQQEKLALMIKDKSLNNNCFLLGSMKPQQVRENMERAQIFLFTSDRQEGWGAVLNESMNSGCAVVASHEIGSVPYLIENEKNGLIYKSGDIDMLYEKVASLLDNPQKRADIGSEAYKTITTLWNADVAAERFKALAEHISQGDERPNLYESGPCSTAEEMKDDWM